MNHTQPPHPRSRRDGDGFTAVVAVLGLLVAVTALLFGDELLCKIGVDISTCAKPPDQPDKNGDATGGPTTTKTPTPSAPDGDVRWRGAFVLRMVEGAELDTDPPSAASGPAGNLDDGDLFYDNR